MTDQETGSAAGAVAGAAVSTYFTGDPSTGAQAGSVIGSMLGGALGQSGLSHEQREALEKQRNARATVPGILADIQAAQTLEQLWARLVWWGSGYTGGSHPGTAVQIAVIESAGESFLWNNLDRGTVKRDTSALAYQWDAKGWVDWPDRYARPELAEKVYAGIYIGTHNPHYPVWRHPAGFFAALLQHPSWVKVFSATGVDTALLKSAVTTRVQQLSAQSQSQQSAEVKAITATGVGGPSEWSPALLAGGAAVALIVGKLFLARG